MPHPCLDARFITPALTAVFELFSLDPTGGTELGPEACEIVVQAVEAALLDGDGVEAPLETEFETLVTGSHVPSISPDDRLWRIRLLYLLYRSQSSRRRGESAALQRRAQEMVEFRVAELIAKKAARDAGTRWSTRVKQPSAKLLPDEKDSLPAPAKRRKPKPKPKAKKRAAAANAEVSNKKAGKARKARARRKSRSVRSTTAATETQLAPIQPPAESANLGSPDRGSRASSSDSLTPPPSIASEPAPASDYESEPEPESDSESDFDSAPARKKPRHSNPTRLSHNTTTYAEDGDLLFTTTGKPNSLPLTITKRRKTSKSVGLSAPVPVLPTDANISHVGKPRGSVLSTTFAKVLRLVLGLSRPTKAAAVKRTAAPPAQPPVWAESRQELCEALHYYRSYQSGIYMYKRVAYGYLLDGFPSPRDTWAADGRVIISHGGGKAVRAHDIHGREIISLSTDHSPAQARIDTLLRAAATRTPLILLAGEGYAFLPWKLPCQYAVLGWYWVSAAWFEPEPAAPEIEAPEGRDYFHRLKVRFDWVESQGTPWWLRDGEGSWVPGTRAGGADEAEMKTGEAAPMEASLGGEASFRENSRDSGEELGGGESSKPITIAQITAITAARSLGHTTSESSIAIPSAQVAAHSSGASSRAITPAQILAARSTDRSGTATPLPDIHGVCTPTLLTPAPPPTPPSSQDKRSREGSLRHSSESEAFPVLLPTPPESPAVSFATTQHMAMQRGEVMLPSKSQASRILREQRRMRAAPSDSQRTDSQVHTDAAHVEDSRFSHLRTPSVAQQSAAAVGEVDVKEVEQPVEAVEHPAGGTVRCSPTESRSTTATVEQENASSPHTGETCTTCGEFSPRVYADGWICLVPTCTAFWMLQGRIRTGDGGDSDATASTVLPIPPGFKLTFSPTFLRHVATPETLQIPYPVVPPPPMEAGFAESAVDEAGSRSLWAGWVCTACGRANSRYRWELCECLGCGRQICALTEEHVVPASALPRPRDIENQTLASLVTSVQSLDWGTVISYELPDAGTVYHIRSADRSQADLIWESYQRAAITTPRDKPLFQRRALKTSTVKGKLLSQQFAINSGASYKYIVETLSYSFEEGPACVLQALDVIRNRVAAVLGQTVEFNEVLSVMYREGQKMNWHDDGEKGLGPVVAALSLGSDATMSFRPKPPKEKSKKSIIPDGTAAKRPRAPAAVLNLLLSHGDVVIMAGRQIQFMYDHRVVPHGLRVAATARVIGTDT